MIVVIADDFSGAAEIAGIGYRYGLSVEIQFTLNTDCSADLIVLDADTRALSDLDAVRRTEDLCSELEKSSDLIKIFKKIDSVLRGHIVPELNVLQHYFQYDRILLMPANPSRGRTIELGKYLVGGVDLAESTFASDPIFPARFSYLEDIIKSQDCLFKHTHLQANSKLADTGLVTADVKSSDEIEKLVGQAGENDLCCGAADCFEAFIKKKGFQDKRYTGDRTTEASTIIILNGSTVKTPEEEKRLSDYGISEFTLPSLRNGNHFEIQNLDQEEWNAQVVSELKANKCAKVSIDHPIKQNKELSELFLSWYVSLARHLCDEFDDQLYFGLTGGATAAAVLKGLRVKKLSVKEELCAGVVTVFDQENPDRMFTVKPGSYPWSDAFLDQLSKEA